MFEKKITPFLCILLCVLVCLATFVGVHSYDKRMMKAEIDEYRRATSQYSQYSGLLSYIKEGEGDKYSKLALLINLIENKSIKEYESEAVWNNIYRSLIVSIGDTYGQYFTAEEYNSLLDSGDGNFVGIGVHASRDSDTNGIYLFGIIPDSPAEKAGLKKGDIIIKSEGIEASEKNYYSMLDSIRGEAGTSVELTVKRGGETIEFSVERAKVLSENVIYEKLDNNIAYIKILSFADERVSEEFIKIISKAQNEGCDKFIFDVRNNSGGYLTEICDVLDILLPEGPIINMVDNLGNVTKRNSDANCINGEMVVLCNQQTASAAELFTAALRDYEKAEIVGKKTFGKGTMQSTIPLTDGTAFKISTAYYNPPNNESYDGVGIIPDYEVDLSEKWANNFYQMPNDQDDQLKKAIELLVSTN